MTRSQLIEVVARRCHINGETAERAVRAIFDSMVEALADGGDIELRGLGSFTMRSYGAYRGRNPRSGEPVDVAAKRVPHFKPGKPLRAQIARRHARRG